jgi:hypothetical protein
VEKDMWLVYFMCQAIDHQPSQYYDRKNWRVFSTESAAKKFSKKWNKENTCYTWSEIQKIKGL